MQSRVSKLQLLIFGIQHRVNNCGRSSFLRERELIVRDVSRKYKVTLRSIEGRVHFALGVWQTAREAESSQEKSAKGAR